MKEFFKNLGRYKVSSTLNILGLGIAFAAAYIILVQVSFDLTYNRCFKDAERIYRLEFKSVMGDEGKKMPHVSHYVGESVGDNNANVEEFAWAFPYPQQNIFIILPQEEIKEYFQAEARICSYNLPQLFNIPFLDGSYKESVHPNSIVISESFAQTHNLKVSDVVMTGNEKAPNMNVQTIRASTKRTCLGSISAVPANRGGTSMRDSSSPMS